MSNEIKIKVSSESNTSGFRAVEKAIAGVEKAALQADKAVNALDKQITGLKDKTVNVKVKVDGAGGLDNMAPGDQTFRIKAKIDDPGPGAAKSFVTKFADGATAALGPAMKVMGSHAGITVGTAAGVAAAPVLMSALGSAVSAVAGAGVIGAGIALAVSSDEGLKSAGQLAGKKFLTGLQEEAKVFVGPIRESLTVLGDAGDRMTARWGAAFDALAPHTVGFVEDVVNGVERISNAFTDAAKASGGAALEGLGSAWKQIADGAGDFIDIVSDGGPDAAANLELVAGASGTLLRQTGSLIDITNQLANEPLFTGPALPLLRQYYEQTGEAAGTFGVWVEGSAEAMRRAEEAALGETSALEGLAKELKAQADPVFGIIKAQDDLAAAQKKTAEATKEHGADSAEAEAALQKQALAALALESNIGKLGDTFDGKLSPSMRATFRAAGLTDKAIDRLEKQFRDAKRAGDQFSKTYRAKASLDAARAQYGINGLLRDLRAFDGVWTATMVTNYVRHGKPGTGGGLATGGIKGAANGASASDMTWVGEQGPELVNLPPGSRVHSNPDSQRMAANAGGGGPGGMITVNLVVDGRVLAQAMMDPQRDIIRGEFGGDVQQALGRNG
jgi:hypothetical protein